ncbi:hypothetical protein ACFQ0P_04115 [Microbacterium insulae]|uniref:Acyl dehydratase n=1 Tax=Microbacterium insulae TaxID=483014 RepID=A0ABW3AH27_9MICO
MNSRNTVLSLADLARLEGEEATGDWFSVDAEHVAAFDKASYFPADEDYMDGYPDGLVEGFYLLALLDEFGSRLFPFDTQTLIPWNYGLDRVRFITPVHIDEPLRLSATITRVDDRGDSLLVATEYRAELAGADRPAFVAEQLTLWREKTGS